MKKLFILLAILLTSHEVAYAQAHAEWQRIFIAGGNINISRDTISAFGDSVRAANFADSARASHHADIADTVLHGGGGSGNAILNQDTGIQAGANFYIDGNGATSGSFESPAFLCDSMLAVGGSFGTKVLMGPSNYQGIDTSFFTFTAPTWIASLAVPANNSFNVTATGGFYVTTNEFEDSELTLTDRGGLAIGGVGVTASSESGNGGSLAVGSGTDDGPLHAGSGSIVGGTDVFHGDGYGIAVGDVISDSAAHDATFGTAITETAGASNIIAGYEITTVEDSIGEPTSNVALFGQQILDSTSNCFVFSDGAALTSPTKPGQAVFRVSNGFLLHDNIAQALDSGLTFRNDSLAVNGITIYPNTNISGSFINNDSVQQTGASFSIDGSGTIGANLIVGNTNSILKASSLSVGESNVDTGEDCYSIGEDNVSGGDYSGTWGNSNNAIGLASTAFGYDCTASSDEALAAGVNCTASGLQSVAMGYSCVATQAQSWAIGLYASATGQYAFHWGTDGGSVSGSYSTCFGIANVSGENSFASTGGNSGTVNGSNAVLFTSGTANGDNSVSFRGNADGAYSTAIGNYAEADSDQCFIVSDLSAQTYPTGQAQTWFRDIGGFYVLANSGSTPELTVAPNTPITDATGRVITGGTGAGAEIDDITPYLTQGSSVAGNGGVSANAIAFEASSLPDQSAIINVYLAITGAGTGGQQIVVNLGFNGLLSLIPAFSTTYGDQYDLNGQYTMTWSGTIGGVSMVGFAIGSGNQLIICDNSGNPITTALQDDDVIIVCGTGILRAD